ncbi:PAS domain-containing sensor histidine kinase [Aquincola sp. J276]|uniref:hybrid sensor histidine kinase/response regulator n=1 Tax=Aquincola sp. J276 TaxID=2898432 RepID=UPI002151AC2D|nr:PAS domain-containing sensor histidine kinase [Aquincola sp. J276]MCR5868154.1 PAS domain S-box protein [Aquincola sp. J276]
MTAFNKSSLGPRPTEPRYRLLVDAITDHAIFMLDPDGFVTTWNPGAHRLKGYSEADILGQHFSRFYLDEDVRAGSPGRALVTAERAGRYETEGWRVRKDGSRFWANVVIDPVWDPQGVLIGFASVTRDLTDRKAADEGLRRSEEQFRLLVQSVTDYAIYMIDPDGIITNWNAGAQRIKGYAAEEVIGTPFARFYPADDQASGVPARALHTALVEGRFVAEGWRVRKDGSRFWASVVIEPMRDAHGQHIGFAKVTRDVTEKRTAQQALETAREELFQAQKLEALGQLTGGVAHDFNNLLMVVISSLTLARRRLPVEQHDVLRLLHNAAKAARRGVSLTQRMLAFARRQSLSPRAVDLSKLLQDMQELLEQSVGPTVEVAVNIPRHLPRVAVDAHQLELAILNLAVNARDAMPEGGRLRIEAKPGRLRRPEGNAVEGVCISVADNGVGMDSATLARAAEPFFTTKGTGKGTGLGLPMVHGLAAQSGGQLLLRSEQAVGTTAEVWLPLASEDMAEDDGSESASQQQRPHTGARRLTVLLVDDDPLVLDSAAAMLEDEGHDVVRAGSAEQAMQLLSGEQLINVVVTDYAMPRMNGVDLAKTMAASGWHLPVVLASGFAEAGGELGIDCVSLSKPFSQEQLQAAIEEAFDQRDRGGAGAGVAPS